MPSLLTPTDSLTSIQQEFLQSLYRVTPKGFTEPEMSIQDRNYKMLGMAGLAIQDFNLMPPQQNASIDYLGGFKQFWPLFTLGTNYYVATFKRLDFTLVDISYSDGGLTLNVDRVGKIGQSLADLEKIWLRTLQNHKWGLSLQQGGVGLGTPRFQSNISKFVGMLSDGAFGWGIP